MNDVSELESLRISDDEFNHRIKTLQNKIQENNLDALFVFSSEAEPANVRYLSDYWPNFETAGIIIPADSEAVLIIGPESLTYAMDRSRLKEIRRIKEFRESSDPEYPDSALDTFESVFDEITHGEGVKRLGIVGSNIITLPVYEAIRKVIGKNTVVKMDDILISQRMIKSEQEIKILKKAGEIAVHAAQAIIKVAKPDMTEIELLAEAEYSMLKEGAESAGWSHWVCSGPNTKEAISRPTYRKVKTGEIIQICMGPRLHGYVSNASFPFVIDKAPNEVKKLINAGISIQNKTKTVMRAGLTCNEVQKEASAYISKNGWDKYILYGPAHGAGLMECEHPFVESTCKLMLEPNMVFGTDTFLYTKEMGVRFEDVIRITKDGNEQLSPYKAELIEL